MQELVIEWMQSIKEMVHNMIMKLFYNYLSLQLEIDVLWEILSFVILIFSHQHFCSQLNQVSDLNCPLAKVLL